MGYELRSATQIEVKLDIHKITTFDQLERLTGFENAHQM